MKDNLLKPIYIIFLIIIIFLFVSNCVKINFLQDDAFTVFRYIKNFVEGKGLVFNEGERVEGYTSFLFVMILSAAYKIGFSLENSAHVLSVFFGVVVLIITHKLFDRFVKYENIPDESFLLKLLKRLLTLLPVFLLTMTGGYIYWSVSGMETTLFIALILYALFLYQERVSSEKVNLKFLIAIILTALTRPEGMVVYFIFVIYDLLRIQLFNEKGLSENNFKKILIKEFVLFSAFLGVYICFRLIYYGYPLPNTYYAKTHFSFESLQRGSKYFFDFIKAYLLYGVILLAPSILLINEKLRAKALLFYSFIIPYTTLIILIGGDVLPFHRFLLPILPLVYVLFIVLLKYLIEVTASKFRRYVTVFYIIIIFFSVGFGWMNHSLERNKIIETKNYEAGLVKKMKIYASWVKDRQLEFHGKYKVALSTIGAFSYFSDAKVIDIIGLTNEYIAHNPKEVEGINDELPILWKERHYNAEYVLSQQPDYVIFPAGAKPSAFPECAIFVQKDFFNNYYPQLIYSSELNQLLPIFTRKSFLKGIDRCEKDTVYECNSRFVKHYIIAYNLFLKMIENNSKTYLDKIEKECLQIQHLCSSRESDALTILGMANYHALHFEKAEEYLSKAIELDNCNSIAHFYLKNIFLARNDSSNAINSIREIMKYSPYALPNLLNRNEL